MAIPRTDCCVLNAGPGAWAFEPLANQLAAALGIDVSTEPRRFNYVLHLETNGNRPVGLQLPDGISPQRLPAA